MRPGQVSYSRTVRHTLNSGPTTATGGRTATASVSGNTSDLPRNSSLVTAYAASVAKRTAKTVVSSAIPTELTSARVNSEVPKMLR